jgi:Ca2+-binding RTX toxin-like protein
VGGIGKDTVTFAKSKTAVVVNLRTGTSTGEGSDTLSQVENVIGSKLDDTLIGSSGPNKLTGGTGVDTVSYASATGAVTVNLTSGKAGGADGTDTLKTIENVTGSGFADAITGNSLANLLSAGAGNDSINAIDGISGNDTVDGGTESDSCQADAGDVVTNCEA